MKGTKRIFLFVALGLFLGLDTFAVRTFVQPAALRFDGVYQSKMQEDEISGKKYKFWGYLLFRVDGTVLGTSTVFPPQELLQTSIERIFFQSGRYTVKRSEIRFSLTSNDKTVDYAGSIVPDGLKLESYRRWDQRRESTEYHFVPLAEIEPTVLAEKSGVRLEVMDRSGKSMRTNDYGQPSQVFSYDGLLLLKYEYDGAYLTAARARFYFQSAGQGGDYKCTITLRSGEFTASKDAIFSVERGKKYAIEVPIRFGDSTTRGAGVRSNYSVGWVSSERVVAELSFQVPAWKAEIGPPELIPLEADSKTTKKD